MEKFNNSIWDELLTKLRQTPQLVTKARGDLNKIQVKDGRILVATKKDWKEYKEVKRDLIEKTYNALIEKRILSQEYIMKDLNNKRSAFTIAALCLLDNIKWNDETQRLCLNITGSKHC